MWDALRLLFSSDGFTPRWVCGDWTSVHGWTHVAADLAIFGAYTAIPITLGYFVSKRRDVPFPRIFWLFMLFIFSCGTTHLIGALLFWHPVYRVDGLVKVVTALASWGTVAAMIPIIPRALNLPNVERMNVALAAEVARRTDAERALIDANAELNRKNDEMEEFVSIIAHDLKHPAVSIQWLLSALKSEWGQRLDDDNRQNVELMLSEAARMKEMLGQLSELAKLERIEVRYEPTDLARFLDQCADPFRSRLQARSCAIEVHAPPVTVDLPVAMLQQAIANLIDNALKYGCPGSAARVDVRGELRDGQVHITVADNGPGIDPRYHERVFQPFRRLARDEQAEGTGIGLTAVRRLAQRFHGCVMIDSEPGKGAKFTISLPTHARPAPADVPKA